jgi:hypothetical protein
MPTIPDLTVEDVVADPQVGVSVRHLLNNWRGSQARLSVYGKTDARILSAAWDSPRDVSSKEDAVAFATWITKLWDHSNHITSNIELFLPMLSLNTDDSVSIRHAGIQSTWMRDDIGNSDIIRIKVDAIAKLFGDQAKLLSYEESSALGYNSDRAVFRFVNSDKFADDYIADSSQPLMVRTKWLAERKAWQDAISGIGYSSVQPTADGKSLLYVMPCNSRSVKSIGLSMYRRVAAGIVGMSNRPTSADLWRHFRNEVIRLEARANGTDEAVLQQLKYNNYEQFWSKMKQDKKERAKVVDQAAVEAMWATIPIAEAGTESSRGWGIEVETVRANQTSRPRGWEDVYDGSLPESGGGCNCGCDDCCNGDHCDYEDDDCFANSGGGESREFVSPILRYFNSNGLRQLCGDLGDVEQSTAPGIHVHVGAEDLTVTDVARVLFAYGVVAPFIQPLYHRKVFGYCQEMPGNNVQWWLTAAKRRLQETGRVPRPADICHEQPVNRYQDVNTHALAAHQTLEFRAMGPFYNYEHLVRWAWFCREMLNVSRLNLDQRVWTSCESLTDVINVLRKYGSEFPTDKSLADTPADTNTYEE